MTNEIKKERFIDPFFNDALNQVFLQSEKSLFAMDGAIGTGKTSEFTIRIPYTLSCLIEPIKKGQRKVRESKWAFIRQSEQSAYNTLMDFLVEAIFSPDIIAQNPNLIKTHGKHPKVVMVSHDLSDGTSLEMNIECHGFNNADSYERLKTHQFMGAMIPEMQSIPWIVVETAIERCGRWRADTTIIKKMINGKEYILSGQAKLEKVFADINIPPRPHPLYTYWYDTTNHDKLPYLFLRPPQPILPIPFTDLLEEKLDILKEKYPTSIYLDEEVVWIPNPKAYNFTQHYEEKDKYGRNIPWTGFNYWLKKVHRSEDEVIRYVVGKPAQKGGKAAIYRGFSKEKNTKRIEIDKTRPVYIGFDPGAHAGIAVLQWIGDGIHVHKEFVFTLSDNASTREQLKDFLVPWCKKHLQHTDIIIVPDPASAWLGKSKMIGSTESALNVIRMMIKKCHADPAVFFRMKFEPPKCTNQQVDVRIDSLKYFIDQKKITVDPECEVIISGLIGDYKRKQLKSGEVSDIINKAAESCDVVEALQYPVVNILQRINKKRKSNERRNSHQGKQGRLVTRR